MSNVVFFFMCLPFGVDGDLTGKQVQQRYEWADIAVNKSFKDFKIAGLIEIDLDYYLSRVNGFVFTDGI